LRFVEKIALGVYSSDITILQSVIRGGILESQGGWLGFYV